METILVVEDAEDIQVMLCFALKRSGYKTLVAANGIEGLAVLNSNPVDLILLDLMMPEMDGWEMLSIIQGNEALVKIPVIVVSGVADHGSWPEGATLCVQKPIGPTLLIDAVRAILAGHTPSEKVVYGRSFRHADRPIG